MTEYPVNFRRRHFGQQLDRAQTGVASLCKMTSEGNCRLWLSQLALLVGCVEGIVTADVNYIKVGIVVETGSDVPYDMRRSGAAIDLAIDKINAEILNASYRIQTTRRTFCGGCNVTNAIGKCIAGCGRQSQRLVKLFVGIVFASCHRM